MRVIYAWALVAVMASVVISFFVSLQLGLFALLFTCVAWWVWENPADGFLLFLIIAPLLPMFKLTQTIGTVTLIKDVIILVLFGKLFAWPLFTKTLPYRRNILFAPLLALCAWTAVGLLRADSHLVGILRTRELLLYPLLYLAVLYLPYDQAALKKRLKWFSASLVVVLMLGVYQWFFAVDSSVLRFDPVRSIWVPRLASTFGHPTVFGHYLLLACALFGALAMYLKKYWRVGAVAACLALVPFIYLTYSRAVWLGWGIVIAIMILAKLGTSPYLRRGRPALGGPGEVFKWSIPPLLFIILIFVLIRFTPAGSFLRATLNTSYASNQIRLDFLTRLIAPMTNTDALIGRGLGDVVSQNFRQIDISAIDVVSGESRIVQLTKDSTLVDNQYLKTFVEMGLIGLIIYAWLFWRLLTSSWQLLTTHYSLLTSIIGLFSLAFLIVFVIQALFVDIWDVFPTNAYFWALAAILSAYSGTCQKLV